VWLTAANQGTSIPETASISGGSVEDEIATLAALVEVSNELLADGRTTFEGAILEAFVNGLNYRLDWSCFRASDADTQAEGKMTGIFAHANVPAVSAEAGRTSVSAFHIEDFANTIAAVAPSALSRECSFFISPSFLPKLITLNDNGQKILQPPRAVGDDWMLAGFPCIWTAAAPDTDGASKQVAAFGRNEAYSVILRQEFQLERSEHARFLSNTSLLRATMRARGQMRQAAAFAILSTAGA
jgi:HK97 family phage major capsid protein